MTTSKASLTGERDEALKAVYSNKISLRGVTPPEDAADMVAFLVPDSRCNLSGQSFPLDGNVETLSQPDKPFDIPLLSNPATNMNSGKFP